MPGRRPDQRRKPTSIDHFSKSAADPAAMPACRSAGDLCNDLIVLDCASSNAAVLDGAGQCCGLLRTDLLAGRSLEQGTSHVDPLSTVGAGKRCSDDPRGLLVEPAQQTEEMLPAGLGEGQSRRTTALGDILNYSGRPLGADPLRSEQGCHVSTRNLCGG